MTTPIKLSLVKSSSLQGRVCEGLGALEKAHKQLIDKGLRKSFADSVDIDDGLKEGNERANRWDYLLGHEESAMVVALEPHSANTSEVSTVIAKKSSALDQLRDHLRFGGRIAAWYWVASGRVDFAPHDKVILKLEQEGIQFVGAMLKPKHLPRPRESKGPRK